ncbi:large ribosomal subunit protein bL27m-like [Lytechinus pictus]|uniref:large ribosomal subunit protein bL27m-like n=1 Tax=Lytechinus pictus TaxID=7653 RepID=UPI0030B9E23E
MILPLINRMLGVGKIFYNSSQILQPYLPMTTSCIRWASKKAGSSKRNTGGKSSGKRLGTKKTHGQQVYENQILVRQKMHFRYYPGQFVKTGRDKTLVAQVAGTVCFSKQRWHPTHNTQFGREIAPQMTDEEMERTFVHVIPEEEVGNFKLVGQV